MTAHVKLAEVKIELDILACSAAEAQARVEQIIHAIEALGFVFGTIDAEHIVGPREMPIAEPTGKCLNLDELLGEKEAAKVLGNAWRTLQRWRFDGRGPVYHKIGTAIRYKRGDLVAFIAAGRVEPRTPKGK